VTSFHPNASKVLLPTAHTITIPTVALKEYTKNSPVFKEINFVALTLDNPEMLAKHKETIQALNNFLHTRNGDPLPKDVERGLNLSPREIAWWTENIGKVVTCPGFTSASKGKPFNGNTFVTIKIPKGVWSGGKDIKSYSDYPPEAEVLFAPYSSFTIESAELQQSIPNKFNIVLGWMPNHSLDVEIIDVRAVEELERIKEKYNKKKSKYISRKTCMGLLGVGLLLVAGIANCLTCPKSVKSIQVNSS